MQRHIHRCPAHPHTVRAVHHTMRPTAAAVQTAARHRKRATRGSNLKAAARNCSNNDRSGTGTALEANDDDAAADDDDDDDDDDCGGLADPEAPVEADGIRSNTTAGGRTQHNRRSHATAPTKPAIENESKRTTPRN